MVVEAPKKKEAPEMPPAGMGGMDYWSAGNRTGGRRDAAPDQAAPAQDLRGLIDEQRQFQAVAFSASMLDSHSKS
jgi:hypothetical protein